MALLALHILLLLVRGKKPSEIADFLSCSRTTLYRTVAALNPLTGRDVSRHATQPE